LKELSVKSKINIIDAPAKRAKGGFGIAWRKKSDVDIQSTTEFN
jgi:hypothetical protein